MDCAWDPELYYNSVYAVDLKAHQRRGGSWVLPDGDGPWNVEMSALDKGAAKKVMDTPLVRDAVTAIRRALRGYKQKGEPSQAKTGGSSTISLTLAIKDGRVTQLYVLQKKIWYVWALDYAGSFRFVPVLERFFEEGASLYNLDLEVVPGEVSFEAEAAAFWALVIFLGEPRADLCLQTPLMRVPWWGLHAEQRRAIEALPSGHALRELLDLPVGADLPVPVVQWGKMGTEAALAHYEASLLGGGTPKFGYEDPDEAAAHAKRSMPGGADAHRDRCELGGSCKKGVRADEAHKERSKPGGSAAHGAKIVYAGAQTHGLVALNYVSRRYFQGWRRFEAPRDERPGSPLITAFISPTPRVAFSLLNNVRAVNGTFESTLSNGRRHCAGDFEIETNVGKWKAMDIAVAMGYVHTSIDRRSPVVREMTAGQEYLCAKGCGRSFVTTRAAGYHEFYCVGVKPKPRGARSSKRLNPGPELRRSLAELR
ncbi:hypothetical protein JL722_5460 [Aureococcus anophagefferens]|nr:hypothetical protein JL722_5460 [Aureococcus anophagefferens]